MSVETPERRRRFDDPQSTGKRVVPHGVDALALEAIARHGGPLPTPYLFAFKQPFCRDYTGHQKRLRDLRNETNTPHRGPYLFRPRQQRLTDRANYQPIAYELTDAGRRFLLERGALPMYAAPTSGPYTHRFMTATLTASIELACKKAGLTFISQEEILRSPNCPKNTRIADNPLKLPLTNGSFLIPDQLFGIEYPAKGIIRFFALEADRKNEGIDLKDQTKNSYGRKLRGYLDVLKCRTFEHHWGVPNLRVLTVTTNAMHMQHMVEHLTFLTKDDPKRASPFLFRFKKEFGDIWEVPPVMYELLSEPWTQAGGSLDISQT